MQSMHTMKLSAWMRQRGVDDLDVAILLKRTRSSVSRWRRGVRKPPFKIMLAISRLTKGKVSYEDWIGRH